MKLSLVGVFIVAHQFVYQGPNRDAFAIDHWPVQNGPNSGRVSPPSVQSTHRIVQKKGGQIQYVYAQEFSAQPNRSQHVAKISKQMHHIERPVPPSPRTSGPTDLDQ